MTQNTLSQSNTSLQEAIKISRKVQVSSQTSGPFIISKHANQTISNHQVSPSAHWNNAQKEKYSIFVSYFRQLLNEDKGVNENWNIFKGMSRFMKTRNPQQCRSYHLKVLKQFKGISLFVLMVIDRVPKLKERILEAENELSQIQIQFNQYLPEEKLGNLYSIRENRVFDQEEDLDEKVKEKAFEKGDKQQFIKTADSYIQQQNPVNSNNQSFSIFSSRSQFKPFDHLKSKPNRSSLPSFGDEQNQLIKFNQKFKASQSEKTLNHENQFKNYIQAFQHQKNSFSNQNFKVFSNNFDSQKNQEKGMEKMKQFMECHYLFQLWTSKLQKIMRDS